MKNLKQLTGPMRLPFVILAPACALVGLGTATLQTGRINWLSFALAVIAAVSAHISVNAFNEYFDYQTEVDAHTQRTPFSGGSGTLQAHPELARSTLVLSWTTLAILMVILGVLFGFLPRFSLLALLTLVFAIQIIRNVLANSENVPALIPAMGQNVIVNLLTPVLLAIGLFIG